MIGHTELFDSLILGIAQKETSPSTGNMTTIPLISCFYHRLGTTVTCTDLPSTIYTNTPIFSEDSVNQLHPYLAKTRWISSVLSTSHILFCFDCTPRGDWADWLQRESHILTASVVFEFDADISVLHCTTFALLADGDSSLVVWRW